MFVYSFLYLIAEKNIFILHILILNRYYNTLIHYIMRFLNYVPESYPCMYTRYLKSLWNDIINQTLFIGL